MSILLKNLIGEASGTITIGVAGHSVSFDMVTMNDLAKAITKKVVDPIRNKLTVPEQVNFTHDPVLTDASAYHETSGNLNIFIGMFPDKWRPKVLGGVAYVIKQMRIKTEKWETIGQGYADDKKFVRIPVTHLGVNEDPAPTIQMFKDTLLKIKELLELGKEYDTNEDRSSLVINTYDLEERLNTYEDLVTQDLAPHIPLTNKKIRQYLQDLRKLVEWAKKHKYPVIGTS